MSPAEINKALDGMILIVDTREHDTPELRRRLKDADCPNRRGKVDFGDYSASFPLPDGSELNLSDSVAVERKMSMAELAMCFSSERPRFEREFERAKAAQAKLYLLVEGATWESIYNGRYQSKVNPKALVASILAYLARYNCQVVFCKAETSGKLIRDIMRYEGRERLEAMLND